MHKCLQFDALPTFEDMPQSPMTAAAIRAALPPADFGVSAILYEAKVPVASSASAIRTAEGGAESIPALQIKDWSFVLDLGARHGFVSFGTSGHQGQSLFDVSFPQKMFLFMFLV